ncbi:MAG TPA: LemA family protein, partial [Terriglobia bacterium]|nr:LemA family protein [Terriglobia bacterium]
MSTSKILLIILAIVALVVVVGGVAVSGTYNSLVQLDQSTQAAWAQVESAYQRRLDLIPNLVETVKGAAKFEQDTLTAVVEARSKVGQVTSQGVENITNNPAAFQRFQEAQAGLSSAL